ncbi:MAG: hypothetical protein FWG90_13560 [Oscillospiraceae bacterium]|nr:hypothetical protein [Oscillospiraceae bacterium]
MAGFLGNKCVVCSVQFDEKSDVVVCPDCGTPCHRDCWFKSGVCSNTALHKDGYSWKPPGDASAKEPLCVNCGKANPLNSEACEDCGSALPSTLEFRRDLAVETYMQAQNQARKLEQARSVDDIPKDYNKNEFGGVTLSPFLINFSDRLCGYSPDEDFEGVKMSEIGDFVNTNTHYYLPVFKRIKDTGRAMTWNFMAMIFPELYFANRKMPLVALAVCVLKYLTFIPKIILEASRADMGVLSEYAMMFDTKGSSFLALDSLLNFASYIVMFVGGALSNWIYYKHSIKKISEIKSKAKEQMPDVSDYLRKKGGTSALMLGVFILIDILPVVLLFGIAFAAGGV